jgi:hypothetical protein
MSLPLNTTGPNAASAISCTDALTEPIYESKSDEARSDAEDVGAHVGEASPTFSMDSVPDSVEGESEACDTGKGLVSRPPESEDESDSFVVIEAIMAKGCGCT